MVALFTLYVSAVDSAPVCGSSEFAMGTAWPFGSTARYSGMSRYIEFPTHRATSRAEGIRGNPYLGRYRMRATLHMGAHLRRAKAIGQRRNFMEQKPRDIRKHREQEAIPIHAANAPVAYRSGQIRVTLDIAEGRETTCPRNPQHHRQPTSHARNTRVGFCF